MILNLWIAIVTIYPLAFSTAWGCLEFRLCKKVQILRGYGVASNSKASACLLPLNPSLIIYLCSAIPSSPCLTAPLSFEPSFYCLSEVGIAAHRHGKSVDRWVLQISCGRVERGSGPSAYRSSMKLITVRDRIAS